MTEAVLGAPAPAAAPAAPPVAPVPASVAATTAPAVPAATPAPAAAAPAAPAAPIVYDFKVPEGMTLHADTLKSFTEKAQALKLGAEDAQSFVDLAGALTKAQVAAFAEQGAQQRQQWVEAAHKDAEFGGESFDANLAAAASALKTVAPELRAFLDETGLGDHPEMIRLGWRLSKLVAQDGLLRGGPGAAPKSPAAGKDHSRVMYPNLK